MNFLLSKLHLLIAKYKLLNPKGLPGLMAKIGIGLSVLIAGVVFAIKAYSRERTRALTQQQADLLQEMAHQSALNAQLAETDKDKQQHLDRAQAAQVIADHLKDDVATLDAQHNRDAAIISGLKSWADVDQHIVNK